MVDTSCMHKICIISERQIKSVLVLCSHCVIHIHNGRKNTTSQDGTILPGQRSEENLIVVTMFDRILSFCPTLSGTLLSVSAVLNRWVLLESIIRFPFPCRTPQAVLPRSLVHIIVQETITIPELIETRRSDIRHLSETSYRTLNLLVQHLQPATVLLHRFPLTYPFPMSCSCYDLREGRARGEKKRKR